MHKFSKVKSSFDKRGFCIVQNFFSKKEVNLIINNVIKHEQKNKNNFQKHEVNYVGNQLNSLHNFKNNSFFDNLANSKNVLTLSSELLGKKTIVKATEYFAKPKKIGLASPMHQDNFYWCYKNDNALTMWIALDNCTRKNGSLYYFSKSHKLGLLPHEPSYAPGSSQTVSSRYLNKLSKRRTFVTLKAGDCLVHHCLSVHGSEKNKSSMNRRGFVIQFRAADEEIDKRRFAIYKNSLKDQVKRRHRNTK